MDQDAAARRRAAMLIDAGRPADAMAVLNPLIASNPAEPETLRLVAHAQIGLGRYGEAKRTARRVLGLQPADAAAFRLIAIASIRSGHHYDAAEAARKARSLAPDDWRTHYLVAVADSGAKDVTEDTHASAAEAIRFAPQSVEPRFAAGLVAHASRDWRAAEHWYREALCIDPNHADARNNLAVLRLKKGDHGQAARAFADMLGEDPTSARARRNVAVAYRTAMRWGVSATVSASLIRMLAVLGFAGFETSDAPQLGEVFSAVMTGSAVIVFVVIGVRFVARLGRHRRAILGDLVRDTRSFASVVATAVALACLVASFFLWPLAFAEVGGVSALAAVLLFRAAVARARP